MKLINRTTSIKVTFSMYWMALFYRKSFKILPHYKLKSPDLPGFLIYLRLFKFWFPFKKKPYVLTRRSFNLFFVGLSLIKTTSTVSPMFLDK